jgi:hypothetical protein
MKDSLEDIIRKGFGIWRKNPDLALPFLFSTLSSIILMVALILCFILLFGVPITLDAQRLLEWGSLAVASRILELFTVSVLFYIIFLILNMLISSFFYAGAVGMTKKAIETGRTSLDDMMDTGKRRFLDLLLNQLAITLLSLFAAALFIGVSLGVFALTSAVGFPQQPVINFGVRLFTLAELLLSLVFLMSPFFVVLGEFGALGGLTQSYKFFMKNKISVLLMYSFFYFFGSYLLYVPLSVFLLMSSLGLLLTPIPWNILSLATLSSTIVPLILSLSATFVIAIVAAFLAILAVLIFVTQPLATIWLTLLYTSGVEEK